MAREEVVSDGAVVAFEKVKAMVVAVIETRSAGEVEAAADLEDVVLVVDEEDPGAEALLEAVECHVLAVG